MSEKISKARINKKIDAALSARENEIINAIFYEFMRCLRPKPRLVPQKFWTWFTRRFVFDLSRCEKLDPNRHESVKADVSDKLTGTIDSQPRIAELEKQLREGGEVLDALLQERAEAQKRERDLVAALRWCAGQSFFQPGGCARTGWMSKAQPLLDGKTEPRLCASCHGTGEIMETNEPCQHCDH